MRRGGVSAPPFDSLNVGLSSGDDPEAVAENRRRVAKQLGFETPPVFAHQVHGTHAVVVDNPDAMVGDADALITDRPGVLLGVLGADCPGVALVAPEARVVAVVHAGWRGVAGGIVDAALDRLASEFQLQPDAFLASMGPGISRARYEVSDEVADAIRRALRKPGNDVFRASRPGHTYVDLHRALASQLTSRGVGLFGWLNTCTFDTDATWFSHRRDGPRTGRHGLFAGWLP